MQWHVYCICTCPSCKAGSGICRGESLGPWSRSHPAPPPLLARPTAGSPTATLPVHRTPVVVVVYHVTIVAIGHGLLTKFWPLVLGCVPRTAGSSII